jgi:hypothetical protein
VSGGPQGVGHRLEGVGIIIEVRSRGRISAGPFRHYRSVGTHHAR